MTNFAVLGPIEVSTDDGVRVELRGALQRRLLQALLLHRGRVVSVDRIEELVWIDDDAPFGTAALQSHVFRLRQRLPGVEIEHRAPGYVLHVDDERVDAHRFERALWSSIATRADDPAAALAGLDEALELWRGEPYTELADGDDGRIEIARLEELRSRAIEERFGVLLELGRSADAIADLEAFVARQPLRERPRLLLIDALSAQGRRAEALRVFDAYRRLLAEEIGVDPSIEIRTRHEQLLTEDGNEATTASSPRARTRGNLRHRASSFVGRDELVADIADRIAEQRLITLLGPGGAGKTRLAVETARLLTTEFPDGVVFCDLTGAGPVGVAAVVADAAGIESRSGQDELERVEEVLRHERCLLVLDNCEHVVDEAAALVEGLLGRTEHVAVIATSRIRLAVEGEHLLAVPPLPSGPDGSPATDLFVDRARAVVPGFELDATNRDQVEDLCQRLDGLPLAIELAAARLQSMSLSEISDGLDRSISVLHGGRRTVDRHRSVEAALDWSYEALEATDRHALHAAATFATSFDAGDIAAVLAVEVGEAVDRMATLVECSLAHRVGRNFALLDVVRRYATEHAADAVQTRTMAERQAVRMLEHAEHVARLIRTATDSIAVDELTLRLADFRRAIDTAVAAGDADTSLRIVTALREIDVNTMTQESTRWGEQAAELGATVGHPLTAAGYAVAGIGAWKRSDLSEMRRLLELADDAAGRLGIGERFEVLGAHAVEHLALGRLDAAIATVHLMLACDETIGDPLRLAESGATLAMCLAYSHDPSAIQVADDLVAEIVPIGGAVVGGWCHYAAGETRLDSDPDAARAHLERSIRLARAGGNSFVEGIAGASLASLDVRSGEADDAIAVYRWLLPLFLRSGVRSPFWTSLRSVAELCAQIGADEPATRLLAAVMSPTSGHEVYGDDVARLTALQTQLRQRLGDDRFEAAFEAGSTLDDAAAAMQATAAFDAFG